MEAIVDIKSIMAIILDNISRPKADPNQSLNLTFAVGTTVEYDGTGGSREGFVVPFNLDGVTQPSFSVANIATTNGSPDISTTGNSFASVLVGDGISGTGIPASTTVIAKADDNNLTLSANATADGTETLTLAPNPGTINPTLFSLGVDIIKQGTKLVAQVSFYGYDGTLGGTAGDDTNASSTVLLGSQTIELDSFLSNARVPRQN